MAKSNIDKIDFSGINEGIEVTTSKNKKKKNNKTLWIAAIAVIAFGIFAQMKINSQEQNQESKQAPQTAQKQEQNSSQIPTSKNNTESDISKSIPSDYPKNELTDQNSTDGQDALDTQKDQIIANVQKEIKNVATDKTDKNVGQDELSWKRRTASFFNNEGQMQFILDAEVPSVIANNFKQEAQNQYRIAGTDAKISNISFAVPENRSDFLSIKFIIESIDTQVTYRIEKFYRRCSNKNS